MRLRILFAIPLLVALLCAQAAAQPAAKDDDDSLNQAREAFDQGQGLFEQQKFDEAATSFIKAYEARQFAAFLYNAALSYEKARNYEKAIEEYKRYLAEATGIDEGEKKEIEQRIAVFEAELQRRATQPAGDAGPTGEPSEDVKNLTEAKIRGLVVVESRPQGAYIYLDDKKGEALGRTPWNGTLEGEHTVFLESAGYKPVEQKISAAPDKMVNLVVVLAEEDYLGWIDIRANVPGANIYIDDKVAVFRRTPYSGNIKPGKHKIWVTKEGYDEYATEIEIIPGQTHEVRAELKGGEVGYINVRGREVEKIKLFVDGEKVCEGPCRWPVAEGPHTIKITRAGYKTYTHAIDVRQKTEVTVRPNLAKNPSRADAIWAYVFAAAFTGGGIYLGVRANGIEDDIKADIEAGMPPPDPEDPRFFRGKLFAIGADAAYTLGLATAAAAVYYTFRDKGRPSSATTDVSSIAINPQVSPDYAGVGMEVRW